MACVAHLCETKCGTCVGQRKPRRQLCGSEECQRPEPRCFPCCCAVTCCPSPRLTLCSPNPPRLLCCNPRICCQCPECEVLHCVPKRCCASDCCCNDCKNPSRNCMRPSTPPPSPCSPRQKKVICKPLTCCRKKCMVISDEYCPVFPESTKITEYCYAWYRPCCDPTCKLPSC